MGANSTILQWLNKAYLEESTVKRLKIKFKKAKPFSYLELNDFLQENRAKKLLRALAQEPFIKKQSDLFSLKQTQDFKAVKNKILRKFRSFLTSKNFIDYLFSVTGIKLKIGKIDMNGSLYEDTDYLLCHDDLLEKRKIAFLLYLSNFGKNEGGSLSLMDKKFNIMERIIPKFNKFVFFAVSSTSYHEVDEIIGKKQRLAIGGWLHDK